MPRFVRRMTLQLAYPGSPKLATSALLPSGHSISIVGLVEFYALRSQPQGQPAKLARTPHSR
jgi:hypothetical protein